MQDYLSLVASTRSACTHRTYRQALRLWQACDGDMGCYLRRLAKLSPSTERTYLAAALGYLEWQQAEGMPVDMASIRQMVKRRQRKVPARLPRFPEQAVSDLLAWLDREGSMRDRALLLTLADTGLRISEVLSLTRQQLRPRIRLIGKGDSEALVHISQRALEAMRVYTATHDRPRVFPFGSNYARLLLADCLRQAGIRARITPHSFRHYFVTVTLRKSGGNLKLTQVLARHKSITMTQRYAHLADSEVADAYRSIYS